MQEAVMIRIAIHSLLEMASLNTNSAMSVVATISKLFISDTLDAVVIDSPSISRMGAAISRTTIMMTNGRSWRSGVPFSSGCPISLLPATIAIIPTPAPRYRTDAVIVGDSSSKNNFDVGMLIA